MNELLNELRKRKRSFIIQAIAAVNHSQTLLNDLKVRVIAKKGIYSITKWMTGLYRDQVEVI